MDTIISQKQCTACLKSFPATSEFFHRNGTYKGKIYFHPICKICRNIQKKNALRANPEERAKNQVWSKAWNETHKEQRTAYNKAYRQANGDRLRAHERDYHQTHKQKDNERCIKYHQSHSEQRNAHQREYSKGRPIQNRLARQRRRIRSKAVPGTLTYEQIQKKLKKQHYACYYCFNKFEKNGTKYIFQIEHTVPVSRPEEGPRHDVNFVVLSCPTCNNKKKNKLPHEFPEGGRLL